MKIYSFLIIFFICPNLLLAQERIITGMVTSEDGPLAGVNVMVMGTTYGNITDLDGNYSLLISDPDITLVFSFVGYQTVIEPVGNRTVIDVIMTSDITQLEAVVVTGYTTQAKKDFSGAIDVVDVESMKSIPASNVSVQLQGRAPGVTVLNTGELGQPVSVRIRGFSTINDNDPLYIVDGAPADQATVEMLNPNDIESAQVLKDASSASIYGARAANGVIIYTTKKGKGIDKTNITLDAYAGVQYVNDFPETCTPAEVAFIIRKTLENAGLPLDEHPQYSLYDSLGNFVEWGLPDYIIPNAYSIEHRGPLDTTDYDFESVDKAYTRANKEGTDWNDVAFRPALIQNYNLTLTSGSEKGQFALTLGYFNQEGILINREYKKFTLRINTLFNIKNRLRIGENLGISYHRDPTLGFAGGTNLAEIQPVYDIAGNYTGNKALNVGSANPVINTEREKDNLNKYMRMLGSFFLEFDIFKDLTFKTSFSPNLKVTFEDKSFAPRRPEDIGVDFNSLQQRSYNSFNWTWYNTLVYSKTFAEKHNLEILAGTEAIEEKTTWFSAFVRDFYSDEVPYRQLDVGEGEDDVQGNTSEWSMFSLFAKVDYNFRGKYILSGTVRRDGSSRFGSGNKYGVFPAASAAWRISGENFMRNVNFINDLKLRFSWGQTGNQNIGNYRILSTYAANTATAAYSLTGAQNASFVGVESAVFGNAHTKWETNTTINAGIDLSLFDNRFTLTLDWYTRGTEDMLMETNPNALIGQAAKPWDNIGEMKNTGIDFSLNYHSAPGREFTWDAGINFTHYKNEVIKLYEPNQIFFGGVNQVTMEGQPISSYFGLNVLGVYQDEEDVLNGPKYVFGYWDYTTSDTVWVPEPENGVGRWKFEDTNGNDSLDLAEPRLDDRIILGSPHPDFTFGIPMNFNYKGIFLNLFWYGSFGSEAYNNDKRDDIISQYDSRISKSVLKSWGMPGVDNTKTMIPQVNANAREVAPLEYADELKSYFLEDGSFIRLTQLVLGYDFNVSTWRSIENFRVYFQANNLFTFTNFSGGDPGGFKFKNYDLDIQYGFVNDFGVISGSGSRLPKSFLLGLNITL